MSETNSWVGQNFCRLAWITVIQIPSKHKHFDQQIFSNTLVLKSHQAIISKCEGQFSADTFTHEQIQSTGEKIVYFYDQAKRSPEASLWYSLAHRLLIFFSSQIYLNVVWQNWVKAKDWDISVHVLGNWEWSKFQISFDIILRWQQRMNHIEPSAVESEIHWSLCHFQCLEFKILIWLHSVTNCCW